MSQLDDFLIQINSLSAIIGPGVAKLEPATRTVLSTPEIYGLRQIVLTGSGDSYFAAAAVAPMLRALTGLPTQALVSMEASRYVGSRAGVRDVGARGVLVVAISYSGEAARLIEAARRWRARGAITLGVTAAADARLAKSVDRWVDTSVESAPPAPGTRSYLASLLCVFLLAIRIAEVLMRITMDEATALRRELSGAAEALGGLDERLAPQVREVSEAWREARMMDVLGCGPSLASAAYGAAKMVEAAGVHAVAQDAEEFFHLNYFVDHPHEVPAILFAPSNAAFSGRAAELVGALASLGRPSLIVTDRSGFGQGGAELVLPPINEFFAPVLQIVPAALLAAFSAEVRGTVHYRGHNGPWSGARGAGLVRDSKIQLNEG